MAARSRKKAGNPEGERKPLLMSIGTVGDYLDESESYHDSLEQEEPAEVPAPEVEDAPEEVDANVEPEQEDESVEVAPRADKSPKKSPSPKKTSGKKRGPKPSAAPKKKVRKPKTDFTHDPRHEEAAQNLRVKVINTGDEKYVTRADIYKSALLAVGRAADAVNCSRVNERKRYKTATSASYEERLTDAFYHAVGQHYVEQFTSQMPDRLLRQCYDEYRSRNAVDEELEERYQRRVSNG